VSVVWKLIRALSVLGEAKVGLVVAREVLIPPN